MKNEILDDIFSDDLRNQLEPNEKVIWEGQPSANWLSIIVQFVLVNLGFTSFLYISPKYSPKDIPIFAASAFFLFLFFIIYDQYITSKIKYLISNKKVHFQYWENKKKLFLTIPFEKIESVSVERNALNFDYGDITLYADVSEIKLDLEKISGHHSPIFKSIYHVKNVEKYLNLGIKGKL